MAFKYILDTHALVWYLEGNPLLSPKAKAVIDASNAELVLPIIVLLEATFMIEKNRSNIPSSASLITAVRSDPRIEIIPLIWDIFLQSQAALVIPEIHDRLIGATGLYLKRQGYDVALLTRDVSITQSKLVDIVW